MSATQLKKQIRQRIIQQRKHLCATKQSAFAFKIYRQVKHSYIFKQSKRVAFYLAAQGEVDPTLLIQHAEKHGKSIYLPALHPTQKNHLIFIRTYSNTPLVKNQYGILEPSPYMHPWLPAWKLDLVITPLVSFDALGHRLGMGGGYYDRSFAFKRKGRTKPWLMGLAYDFQKCAYLPFNERDVPLDFIATPKNLVRF